MNKVLRNYLYNFSYQILIIMLPLFTTPYISRVLGAKGVGTFGYTNSITQYFVLIGCIGLNLYGQREIAYYQNSSYKRTNIFFELFILRLITISLSLFLFIFTVMQNSQYSNIFSIQIVEIIASMIDISWFFQGMEEFKKIVMRNVLVKLICLVLIFCFVKTSNDLIIYTFVYCLSLFLGNVTMWLYLPKYLIKINFKQINFLRHLKPTLIMFIPQIATSIYALLDKSMIGMITNNESEVAYYEQAQKIIKIAMTFGTSLGTVMLPRIANLYKKKEIDSVKEYMYKSFRFISFVTFPTMFGIIGISDGFVPWFFGEGYDMVIPNMIIISPIIIAIGVSTIVGTQFLLPTQKQFEYTVSVVCGTITNLICNFLLIPKLMSLGAAIATVLAETVITVIQLYYVRNTFNLKKILIMNIKYAFFSIIMLFFVLLFKFYIPISIMSTFLEIIVGCIIYLSLLIFSKDELVSTFINKLKIRFNNKSKY